MRAPNPMTHRCGLSTLDYSTIESGEIRCRLSAGGCGATYHLDRERGWQRDPRPVKARR